MNSARGYEGFSRQHRERVGSCYTFERELSYSLVMGSGPCQSSTTGSRKNRTKARITVVVRKRPLTIDEVARGEQDILALFNDNNGIRVDEPRKNVIGVSYNEPHEFVFDRTYDDYHTNHDVYLTCVRHLVDSVFQEGAKCACFAYGQTGSGKTYTMVGSGPMGASFNDLNDELCMEKKNQSGLLELAAHDCFRWLTTPQFQNKFGLYVSFYEIYCNKVYDLLNRRHLVRALETNSSGHVIVKDLKQIRVDDVSTILKVINSGLEHRIMGMNSKNNDSSRGHAILTLEIKSENGAKVYGKLVFVDLAGSERGIDAMGSGKQTQTDGAGINRSLLALKECIRALDLQSSHVPFRDSELTKVLRDMFVGSSTRTLMISCVSPSAACCEQTLNTLRYADRVKAMRRNGNTAVPGLASPRPTEDRLQNGLPSSLPVLSLSSSMSPSTTSFHADKSLQIKRKTLSSRISGAPGPVQGSLQTPRAFRKTAQSSEHTRISPLKATRTVAKAGSQKKNVPPRLLNLHLKKDLEKKRDRSLSSDLSDISSPIVMKDSISNPERLSKSHSSFSGSRPGRSIQLNSKQSKLPNSVCSGLQLEVLSTTGVRCKAKPEVQSTSGSGTLALDEDTRTKISDFKSSSCCSSCSQDCSRENLDAPEKTYQKRTSRHKSYKYFPNRDPNTLMAAASILRKKYAEWNFPLVPEEKVPGKYVELDTAVKMIKGISALPYQDVKKFHERYCGRLQQFYTNVAKYHLQYVDAQKRLLSAQRIMLDQLSMNDFCQPMSLEYIEDLRSVVQTQLSLTLRLGKRVTEIERMISLEEILGRCYYTKTDAAKDVQSDFCSNSYSMSRKEGSIQPQEQCLQRPVDMREQTVYEGIMSETYAHLQDACCQDPWKQCDVLQASALSFPANGLSQRKDTTTSTSLTRYTLSSGSSSEQSSFLLSPLCKEFPLPKQEWSSTRDPPKTSAPDCHTPNQCLASSAGSSVVGNGMAHGNMGAGVGTGTANYGSTTTVLSSPTTHSRIARQHVIG